MTEKNRELLLEDCLGKFASEGRYEQCEYERWVIKE